MNKYNKYKKPIYAIRDDSDDSNSNNSDDNSNTGKKKQLWCICRSEDSTSFMICCDSCEEWYHGHCVSITPKQAEVISKYFCAQCQKRNPGLKIQYKPGYIKKTKEHKDHSSSKSDKLYKIKSEERHEKSHKIKVEDRFIESSLSHSKYEKSHKMKTEDKYEKHFKHKSDERYYESSQHKFDKSYKNQKLDDNKSIDSSGPSFRLDKPGKIKSEDKLPEPQIKFSQKPQKPGGCGECMGCLRKVDCNICPNCKTKSDKGCMKRVCSQLSKPLIIDKPNSTTTVPIKTEKVMLTKLPGEFIPAKTAPLPKKSSSSIRPQHPVFSKTNQLPSSSSPSSNENLHHSTQHSQPQKPPLKRPLSPSTESESSSIVSSTKPTINKSNQLINNSSNNTTSSSSHNNSNNNAYSNKLPLKKPKLEPLETVSSIKSSSVSKSKPVRSSISSEDDLLDDNEIDEEDDDEEDDEDDMNDDSDESDDEDEGDDDNEDEDGEDDKSSGSFVLRKTAKISNKVALKSVKKVKPSQSNILDRRSASPYSRTKVMRRSTRTNVGDSVWQYKPVECHNIGCTKQSRVGSKYCSDECGIKLAEQRLLKYLPSRISNWNNSVSVCNQRDRKTQAEIQEECETIHYNLNILDKSHHDLIEFIDRWRSLCTASNNPDDDDRRQPGANDDSVQCVTCGYMVPSLKALAHMENCYQKIEGGTMVFADFEEQPIGTKLFCDYYDNNIRGYCKRLAALCDHNKDAKVDPKTICAFPLLVNEKSSKVCMTAKVRCNRHVNWERIQRAVIDMNRYRLLVRYEELQVEDRRFKHNIAQRGGVMALLMHDTIDHQPLKPLVPLKTKENRNKKMKKLTKAMCI